MPADLHKSTKQLLVSGNCSAFDISVIIVNWNVAALLDGCLRSVEAERHSSGLNLEFIVVDNASDQRDVVDVVDRYPDVHLEQLTENRGYGAANNAGMRIAGGSAILILNPDTELLPGSLRRLWETLHLSPHIGLVAPLLLNPDLSVQSAGYAFPGTANVFFDLFPTPARLYGSTLNGRIPLGNGELPVQIDYALGASLLIRHATLLDVGMFDELFFMYSEEIDLQRRLAQRGWTRLLDPASRVIHYGGQSTGQRRNDMRVALWTSRAEYFRRWNTRSSNLAIRALVNAGTWLQDRRFPDEGDVNAQIRRLFNRGRTLPS